VLEQHNFSNQKQVELLQVLNYALFVKNYPQDICGRLEKKIQLLQQPAAMPENANTDVASIKVRSVVILTKEQFLNDLVRNPSHQMCFCTVQSLQALSLANGKIDSAIYHIDSDVLQALMTAHEMNELDATDKYYTSQTYSRLADETTELYEKSWHEIYQMLKQKLNL
jgi:hypothetical protein